MWWLFRPVGSPPPCPHVAFPASRMLEAGPKQPQPPCLPACHPSLHPCFVVRSAECPRSLNKLSQGAGCQRLHSGALPPLSPPASGESIAMRRPIHPCTPLRAPRSPLLALNPNPLTPLCASPAQDLDDFLSSAARGSGSGRDSQSLDLGWCLRCFYFNYCML